jgi:aminoglycoside phosphotransferase (APT) family kinase protein
MHINGRVQRLRRIHGQLNGELSARSCGRVRVPTFLGELPDLRMALFCEVRGHELDDGARWTSREMNSVVAALAALHQSWIDEVAVFSIADELRVIRRWQDLPARTCHPDADKTSSLVDGLVRLSERIDPTPQCLIHRDFYERQLIIGRHTTTILDLDTLALGQPCLDLGNLLAHVFQTFLLRAKDQSAFEALAAELIRRYEQFGRVPVDREALAFYFASALFRVGAVHAMRTRTRRSTPAMWAATADVLQDASSPVRGSRFRFFALSRPPVCLTTTPRHSTIAMESLR